MKRYTQYISELNHTQINPYLNRDNIDVRDPKDKQAITSKNDLIHVEFEYEDHKYSYDIRQNELDMGTSDNIHWHITKVEDKHGVTFNIHAQKSGTGRFNATILNMKVDVIKKDKKVDEIIPNCHIISYAETHAGVDVNIHRL